MKSIRHKLLALSVSWALAVSLAGCGVNVTGVALDLPDSMEKGSTLTATPEYTFDGATPESATLSKKLDALDMSYTSSDPAVVMVDENGIIAAISAGTAEVALSSKDGKITASKTIEVVVTPTGITTTDALTLTAGEAATLETAVAPDDATHVSISYTSSDDAVATVSGAGEVTAVAAGDATITAAVDGTALSATCKITILPAIESVELNYTTLSLQPKGTAQLTYTVAPEEALADTATYTSSDEAVATVDADGNVTAVADGTATITVDVNGVTAECEVTVSTKATNMPNKTSSGNGSASSNGNNGTSSTYDPSQASESQAAQSGATASFEYGGVPFNVATNDNIWAIDSSDSAYWACANNINAMRAAAGLPALTVSSSLSSIATSRATNIMATADFSHNGQQTAGEILEAGAGSASVACQDWQNSSGHYALITNASFTQMGIGCAFTRDGYTCWCVTFS